MFLRYCLITVVLLLIQNDLAVQDQHKHPIDVNTNVSRNRSRSIKFLDKNSKLKIDTTISSENTTKTKFKTKNSIKGRKKTKSENKASTKNKTKVKVKDKIKSKIRNREITKDKITIKSKKKHTRANAKDKTKSKVKDNTNSKIKATDKIKNSHKTRTQNHSKKGSNRKPIVVMFPPRKRKRPHSNDIFNNMLGNSSLLAKNLARGGVGLMQSGLDTYNGISTSAYSLVRKGSGAHKNMHNKLKIPVVNTVANIVDSGINVMSEANDLSILASNIGLQKIRSKLDKKSGNAEIIKLLLEYAGSKIKGFNKKGTNTTLFEDVNTIANYIIKDDEITDLISQLIQKFTSDDDVMASIIRIIMKVMASSESLGCILDRLPLSDSDIRMVFDLFVGPSGQTALNSIATILSELTGPGSKAFFESLMGMASMFKGGQSTFNPLSLLSSVTGLFKKNTNEPSNNTQDKPEDKQKEKSDTQDNIYGQGDDKSVPVAGDNVQNLENEFGDWFD
ncbi:uncharacterized protein LOC126897765 [Daktulosphaira vitifoliae]|uniref:uncharacterized protein LOC126897765 n=1 Tax=Daktulosphaira vitifoliae TaxID=58002 RepID=UPI0021AA4E98|nr:uncharacterized protein LOC126897765 [Daktulosphaira vitifoliae]XP_050527576.1 uncharacterized protein LOC126897765 [Daktulosphaira vitifoliae]